MKRQFPDMFEEETVLEALRAHNSRHSPTADEYDAAHLRMYDRASKMDRKSLESRYGWKADAPAAEEAAEVGPTSSSEGEGPAPQVRQEPVLHAWVVSTGGSGKRTSGGCPRRRDAR